MTLFTRFCKSKPPYSETADQVPDPPLTSSADCYALALVGNICTMSSEFCFVFNIFYRIYYLLYIPFDKTIYYMDQNAVKSKPFPKWFMTVVSIYGLGFQLFIISLMLVLRLQAFIIPFFIGYSVLIIVFIFIRKGLHKKS